MPNGSAKTLALCFFSEKSRNSIVDIYADKTAEPANEHAPDDIEGKMNSNINSAVGDDKRNNKGQGS